MIRVKVLSDDAKIPTYATDGAGAFDLYAAESGRPAVSRPIEIGTGLAFEIPVGYLMLVFSRSGHGFKYDVRLGNCVGLIDSDYRGEVRVKLAADQPSGFSVNVGDRIAQAIVIPVERTSFHRVDELSETARGDGGFGSTGQ